MAGCVRLYPLQRVTPLSEQTLWGTNWSTHINHQPTENWASLVSGLKRTRKQTRQPALEKRGERPASVPNYFRVAVRANKASQCQLRDEKLYFIYSEIIVEFMQNEVRANLQQHYSELTCRETVNDVFVQDITRHFKRRRLRPPRPTGEVRRMICKCRATLNIN